jgi:hypothetical protein
MGVLLGYLLADLGDDDSPRGKALQAAFAAAFHEYGDPATGDKLLRYFDDMTSAEQRAELLERVSTQRAALLSIAGDLASLADAIRGEDE